MNENEGWITTFSEGQSLKNLRDNTKKYNTCDFREQSKSTVQKKINEAIVPENITNVVKDKLLSHTIEYYSATKGTTIVE